MDLFHLGTLLTKQELREQDFTEDIYLELLALTTLPYYLEHSAALCKVHAKYAKSYLGELLEICQGR